MHRKQRDDAPGLSSRNVLLAVAVSLALAAPAFADVTLKEKTVSTGVAGFGNGTSERTIVIAGDKSRSDEQFTCTGRFKTLAGGGKPKSSADIVRLDRDLAWQLDVQKREFDAENVIVAITATPRDLKGYPVRSTVTVSFGAEATPEQQAQIEKSRTEAQASRAEEQSKREAREDDGAKVQAGVSLSSGNVSGAIGGFLGRKLGKSAGKKAEAGASSQGSGNGTPGGFTATTDILSVSTGAAGVSFDVPPGFKKVERKLN